MSNNQNITRIPVAAPGALAFRLHGKATADDMHAMAKTMNAAFYAKSKLSMLLIFERYAGQETGAGLTWAAAR